MKSLTLELIKKGDAIVTSDDIYKIYPELTENAVQAKIKRCLKSGELKRLYKGIYSINQELLKKPVVEENLAHVIDSESFLSGLAALRFHNLIPETINFKIFTGTKAAKIHADNMNFEIRKVADDQLRFGIETVQVNGNSVRIADPVRAVMDTLLEQKLVPQNRRQICAYLRIDEDEADTIHWENAESYAYRYRNSKMAKKIAAAMLDTGGNL